MTQISLAEYREQIEASIAQERYEEAVAHGRHILEQYPKYVSAYWLLGKAMLEAGQAQHASDMFQRVLSADPENLLAWVSMSEIAEQRGDLEAAVWYLERAFELATDNEKVAEELRHLYGEMEGREPERLQLTQGALARLYLRGDLLSRAINELRKLLDEHPDRVDLRVALAEALWRSGQRLQAAEVCQEILEEQPYNLKANLILGEIWTNSGREEGEFYLERAEAIDPENRVAQELFGSFSPLPTEQPQITHLEYEAPGEEGPAWMIPVGELGPAEEGALARPEDLATSKIEIPEWLRELAGEAGPETVVPVEPAEEEAREEAPAEPAEEELEQPVAAEETAPEEVAPDEVLEEEDLAWLEKLEEGEVEARELEEESVAFEEEIPAWLTDLGMEPEEQEAVFEAEEPEAAPETEKPEPGEIPDWLREMAPAEEERSAVPPPDALAALLEGETPAAEESQEDLLAWLEEEDVAFDDEALDWLEELSEAEEEELLAQVEGESEARLAEILGRPEEPGLETVMEEPEEAAEPTPEAFESEEELPAWLEGEDMPSGDEALAWLEQLSEGKEEELLAQAEAESEARLAEILGEPAEAGPETVTEEPEEVVEEPTLQAEEIAAPEVFESEELPAWLEGEDMPSGDEALAWLEQLSEGKEDELLAQAEAESEARLAEILGQSEFATEEAELEEVKEEGEPKEEAVEELGVEAPTLEAEAAAPERFELEGELPPWLESEDMPSSDEALAWLEQLSEGKEEELPAQAEAESEAGLAEIMGRPKLAPEEIGEEGEPQEEAVEELAMETAEAPPEEGAPEEEAFGWTAFVESVPTKEAAVEEEPTRVEAPEEAPPAMEAPEDIAPVEEAETLPEEEVFGWTAFAEAVAPEGEEAAPEEEVPAEPPEPAAAEAAAEAPAEAPTEVEAAEPAVEEEAVAEGEVPEVVEEAPSVSEPEAVEEAAEPEAIEAEEKVAAPAAVEEPPIEDLGEFIARQRAYAEEHPEADEAWLELGRVLWQADRREEAIETYDRLIRRDSLMNEIIPDLEDYTEQWSDPSAMQALGDAYARADRLQDALDVYRRALESL